MLTITNIIERGLLQIIVTATILNVSTPVSAFSIVFGEVDAAKTVRTDFINDFDTNASSTIIDDGINFGAAPDASVTPGVDSVSRNGNIGTESFSYTIYDVDFNTNPLGIITPGSDSPVNDILELDKLYVETPVTQDVTGTYSWGVDSRTGKTSSPNAALFDFSDSIGHFGVDLHDFEAGEGINSPDSGASGEIRLYKSGSLVHSYTLEFPGVEGGGSTDNPNNTTDKDSTYPGYGNNQSMFVGITADNSNEFFDQVAFVVGDDDVGEDGHDERWAADGFTFGYAYREVPFNFSPTLGLLFVGGFYTIRKIKHRLRK